MRPVTSLPHRTHLEYQVWLDTPVGLTPPKATPAGPERLRVSPRTRPGHIPAPRRRHAAGTASPGQHPQPRPRPGTRRGPHGPADLTALLTFAFPGCQVLAAWLSDARASRNEHSRPAPRQAARIPLAAAAPKPGSGGQGRARHDGDFELRPKDACTVTVILSGPPAASPRRIRRDGTLADGKVTASSCR